MAENLSRTCQKLRPLLPEHAEGKLSGSPLARVQRHLAECSRCSAEVADLRTVIAAAHSIDADPVPAGLVSRLRGAVADLPETAAGAPHFWPRVAVPVAVATGFVALAFAFLITGRPQTNLDSMARSASSQAGALVAEAPAPSAAAGEMPAGIDVAELPHSALGRADRLGQQASSAEPSAPDTAEKSSADAIRGYSFTAPSEEEREGLARRETSIPQPDRSPRPTLLCRDQLGPRDEAAGPNWVSPPPRGQRQVTGGAGRRGSAETAPGAPSPQAREIAPAPPIAAQAVLLRGRQTPTIAFQLTAEPAVAEIAISLDTAEGRRLLWRGAPADGAPIPLSARDIGTGPAALPICLESAAGDRQYVLFVPILARLGESAPNAPLGRYAGAPLGRILADFSSLTGLVILAEAPLDMPFSGDLPSGTPAQALHLIATIADMEATQQDDIAHTLTHRR